ncbi:MAG: hypothetical protein UX80_C0010G0014 [Candidatus Amesbacteria bacterium GW2011_GWA2_47_11b]|uniref:Uncharacterized protein n=2 Tax=Candidatus Amesiibacteriota TaxID=1752730 RepID=A0A0G1TUD9_9BACT|nr:MAG: hypothetical protein UX80_C0010G0014 [Candidatus Amesbacteria bacterium GW2011_GWA2_47_11b]KKU83057.1 MAG: hypothetical protein UY11_C0030G0012 [Candidatus Amesbacteria bacterium GW2011_GWC2_47_8]
MWRYANWGKKTKWIITGVFTVVLILGSSSSKKSTMTPVPTPQPAEKKEEKPTTTKSPQEIFEETLSNTIHKIDSNISYRIIETENADLDRPKDTKMITVSVDVKSFFDKNSLLRTSGKVSSGVFQAVFGNSSLNAYDIVVWYYAETTDKYGNKKDNIVLSYAIDKATFDKINWNNFDQSNLCNFLEQEAKTSGTFDTDCKVLVNIK